MAWVLTVKLPTGAVNHRQVTLALAAKAMFKSKGQKVAKVSLPTFRLLLLSGALLIHSVPDVKIKEICSCFDFVTQN